MQGRRPTIAISSRSRRLSPSYLILWIVVRLAGGFPQRIRPNGRRPEPAYDGLILAGGPDLSPRFVGGKPIDGRGYDPQRDELEMLLLEDANTLDLPILGICRGVQLINVAAGGSIHPMVRKAYKNARYPHHPLAHLLFRKRIFITPGTVFASLAGRPQIMVNSLHRQSIDRLGAGLSVTAQERNGVIQVIERARSRFYVGVQFHPELLLYCGTFRRLFRTLVAEAARRGATGTGVEETSRCSD